MLPNHEGQKVPSVTFPLRINDEWGERHDR